MTKFNVGDKVTCIKADTEYFTKNDSYKVVEVTPKHVSFIDDDGLKNDWHINEAIETFEVKPIKNQRITALENEVAELKLIVHELRGKKSIEPSATNTVEDIIEFEGAKYRKVEREGREGDVIVFYGSHHPQITDGKPYKVFKDEYAKENKLSYVADSGTEYPVDVEYVDGYYVYELIKSKPLTPNQQRAAIIEKAKQFIEEAMNQGKDGSPMSELGNETYQYKFFGVEFDVNEREVKASVYQNSSRDKRMKQEPIHVSVAKCSPTDVFNEHIGKAIALGRALGLDVSEFEQAVQPTIAIDQIIASKYWNYEVLTLKDNGKNLKLTDNGTFADGGDLPNRDWYRIINDTNAIYEVF